MSSRRRSATHERRPRTAAPAKLAPPRLSNAYPRTRLFRELDRALRHPLVWVVAPAGYGKTTLVASYLQARKRPFLWYQLDEGDGDVAAYFHYLSLAARHTAPHARELMPAFTPEYFGAPEVFARRYFERLGARLPRRAVCVFDNYQEVPGSSGLHHLLHDAPRHLRDDTNVVIASRTEPPPEFAVDRANAALVVIGPDALRLSPAESLGIGRARVHGAARAAVRGIVRDLHERCHGWAAGLVLMLEHWSAKRELPGSLGKAAQQPLFDYFYHELFRKADDETRHLLLRTCYLPIVTPEAAQELTSDRRAANALVRLHTGNLFTARHAAPTAAYQYHPLLRDFLRAQAERTLGANERLELLRHSARILEREGRIEDAARLLQTAGEWAALAELAKHHAPAFLADGRHRTVLAWLESLPRRDGDPWLAYWLGVCRFPFALADARTALELAYAMFAARGDEEGRLLSWAAIIEAIVFEASDFAHLDRWIAVLDGHPLELGPPPTEARVVAAMVTALIYRQPQNPRTSAWVERLAAIVAQTPDANARVLLGAHLFVYRLAWLGDLASAESTLRLIRPPRGTRLAPLAEILLQVCVANWCWMTNEPEAAIEAVDAGQRLADEHGIVVWTFRLTCTGADVHFSRGDVRRAAPYVDRLEHTLVPTQTAYLAYSLIYPAWAAALRGDATAAVAGEREVLARFVDTGAPWPIAAAHLQLAEFARLAGDVATAEAHALEGLAIARSFRGALLEYWALCSLASTHYLAGRDEHGDEQLRAAFALGQRQSYARLIYYCNDDETAAQLCARSLEAGIETTFALTMIRERALVPPSATAPEQWPFAVTVYTLNGFAFAREGVRAAAKGKAQHRPLGLLKAAIALGGHSVPETRLAEALWPDADGDAARRSLAIALHRLRRLLGCDGAIRLRDRQVTLDPRYVWVDAWAFERLLDQAQRVRREPARSRALLEKALAYYRAPFLSADAEPWVLPMRERLRGKLLRAIERLGQTLEQQSQWESAVRWYERGIEIDPLAESFYRRQMLCYDALRHPAEALAAYRRCEAALASMLDVLPAPETQELCRKIRAAGRNR